MPDTSSGPSSLLAVRAEIGQMAGVGTVDIPTAPSGVLISQIEGVDYYDIRIDANTQALSYIDKGDSVVMTFNVQPGTYQVVYTFAADPPNGSGLQLAWGVGDQHVNCRFGFGDYPSGAINEFDFTTYDFGIYKRLRGSDWTFTSADEALTVTLCVTKAAYLLLGPICIAETCAYDVDTRPPSTPTPAPVVLTTAPTIVKTLTPTIANITLAPTDADMPTAAPTLPQTSAMTAPEGGPASVSSQLIITGSLAVKVGILRECMAELLGRRNDTSNISITVNEKRSANRHAARRLGEPQTSYNEVNVMAFLSKLNATGDAGPLSLGYASQASAFFDALNNSTSTLALEMGLEAGTISISNGQFCIEELPHCPSVANLAPEAIGSLGATGTLGYVQVYTAGPFAKLFFPCFLLFTFVFMMFTLSLHLYYIKWKGKKAIRRLPPPVAAYDKSSLEHHLDRTMTAGIEVFNPSKDSRPTRFDLGSTMNLWVAGLFGRSQNAGFGSGSDDGADDIGPPPLTTTKVLVTPHAPFMETSGPQDYMEEQWRRRAETQNLNTDLDRSRDPSWRAGSNTFDTPPDLQPRLQRLSHLHQARAWTSTHTSDAGSPPPDSERIDPSPRDTPAPASFLSRMFAGGSRSGEEKASKPSTPESNSSRIQPPEIDTPTAPKSGRLGLLLRKDLGPTPSR